MGTKGSKRGRFYALKKGALGFSSSHEEKYKKKKHFHGSFSCESHFLKKAAFQTSFAHSTYLGGLFIEKTPKGQRWVF